MPKSGRNIYKRKDGRWEGRYAKGRKETGQIVYGYVYAKTCTEVKNKLETVLSSQISTNNKTEQPLFSEMAAQWLFNISLSVKPSSLAHYTATLENHIIPVLGGYKIHMITSAMIDQFAKNKLLVGRKDGTGGLSAKTVRDLLTIIKNVFNYALSVDIAVSAITITYPKREKQAAQILSRQEQLSLEKVLTEEPDVFKLAILISLYTGLRIGEVCALRWRDISLPGGLIAVKRTMRRIQSLSEDANQKTQLYVGTPKSQCSVRNVPLSNRLVYHLSLFARDDDSFFLSGAGFEHTEPRTLQNHFKKYLKVADISPINYHSTRHTFATRCIEAGVDIKSLSEILGHSNVNITLNRYVHSSFEQKKESAKKLERFIGFEPLLAVR